MSKADSDMVARICPILDHEKAVVEEDEWQYRMHQMHLDEDIYSMGFYTFIKATNARQMGNVVMKCFFSFMIQALLAFMLIWNYVDDEGNLLNNIVPGDIMLNCGRLLCSYLLH